jgi:hypothetical protein
MSGDVMSASSDNRRIHAEAALMGSAGRRPFVPVPGAVRCLDPCLSARLQSSPPGLPTLVLSVARRATLAEVPGFP